MKRAKILIIGWAVSSWLISLNASDLSQYSSKAALFGQRAGKEPTARECCASEEASLPNYYTSSKPWLFPQRPAPARIGEPRFATADNSNSKQAARGASGLALERQFELAPLKNR